MKIIQDSTLRHFFHWNIYATTKEKNYIEKIQENKVGGLFNTSLHSIFRMPLKLKFHYNFKMYSKSLREKKRPIFHGFGAWTTSTFLLNDSLH